MPTFLNPNDLERHYKDIRENPRLAGINHRPPSMERIPIQNTGSQNIRLHSSSKVGMKSTNDNDPRSITERLYLHNKNNYQRSRGNLEQHAQQRRSNVERGQSSVFLDKDDQAFSSRSNKGARALSPITVDVGSPLRPTALHHTFSSDGGISNRIRNQNHRNMRPMHSTPTDNRSRMRIDNTVPVVSPPHTLTRRDPPRHNNQLQQTSNPPLFIGERYNIRATTTTDSTISSLQRPMRTGINLNRGRSPARSVATGDIIIHPTHRIVNAGKQLRGDGNHFPGRSRSPSQRTFTSLQRSTPHYPASRSRSVDRSFSRHNEINRRGHNFARTRMGRSRSPLTRSPISLLTTENRRLMRSQSVERSHFRRNSGNSFMYPNLSRPTSINLVEQSNRRQFSRPDRAESPQSIHTEGYNSPHASISRNFAEKSPFSGSASVSIPYSQSYNIVSPPNKLNNSYTHSFRGPQRPLDQDFNPRPEPMSISSPSIRAHSAHQSLSRPTPNQPRSLENRRQVPIEIPESDFTLHTVHSQLPSRDPVHEHHNVNVQNHTMPHRNQHILSDSPMRPIPGRIAPRIGPEGHQKQARGHYLEKNSTVDTACELTIDDTTSDGFNETTIDDESSCSTTQSTLTFDESKTGHKRFPSLYPEGPIWLQALVNISCCLCVIAVITFVSLVAFWVHQGDFTLFGNNDLTAAPTFSFSPTKNPVPAPTAPLPTLIPTLTPTDAPTTPVPTDAPTLPLPTTTPSTSSPTTSLPTTRPSIAPTTSFPTLFPTSEIPSNSPSIKPTISFLPTLPVPTSAPTIGDSVTFFVTAGFFTRADLFYEFGTSPIQLEFTRMIQEEARFLVHLGDFNAPTLTGCVQASYATFRDILIRGSRVPVFVTNGEDDYINCPNPYQAFTYWNQYYANIERNWNLNQFSMERMDQHIENFAFIQKRILFIGIDVVNGGVDTITSKEEREYLNFQWVRTQVTNKFALIDTMVIFGNGAARAVNNNQQASSHTNFFRSLVTEIIDYAKIPTLYVHPTDRATWKVSKPFESEYFTVADFREQHFPFMKITIDPNGRVVYSYDQA